MRIAVALAALAVATAALGQDRPTEEELFGTPPAESPQAGAEREEEPEPTRARGRARRGPRRPRSSAAPARRTPPPPAQGIVPREIVESLRIGGQLYLRGQTLFQEDVAPEDWALTSPNLLDVWLDARPNDRVRAFTLGRMRYDPTAPATATPSLASAEQAIPGYDPSTGGITAESGGRAWSSISCG